MKKIVIGIFSLFRSFRHAIILSGFGAVSYCKHSPTCGDYFIQTVNKQGVLSGFRKGLVRVLRCW